MTTELAAGILQRCLTRTAARAEVIFVDGHSGSGKTTLAVELATQLRAQLVHIDELYPGWEGLRAGSVAVAEVLHHATYQRYDWHQKKFRERITLNMAQPIIIEGCGALTSANLAAGEMWATKLSDAAGEPVSTLGIWLECAADLRQQRAIARDGDVFRDNWEMWAAQERTHFQRELPWALATEIVQSR